MMAAVVVVMIIAAANIGFAHPTTSRAVASRIAVSTGADVKLNERPRRGLKPMNRVSWYAAMSCRLHYGLHRNIDNSNDDETRHLFVSSVCVAFFGLFFSFCATLDRRKVRAIELWLWWAGWCVRWSIDLLVTLCDLDCYSVKTDRVASRIESPSYLSDHIIAQNKRQAKTHRHTRSHRNIVINTLFARSRLSYCRDNYEQRWREQATATMASKIATTTTWPDANWD